MEPEAIVCLPSEPGADFSSRPLRDTLKFPDQDRKLILRVVVLLRLEQILPNCQEKKDVVKQLNSARGQELDLFLFKIFSKHCRN